jgi:hypothetical protein
MKVALPEELKTWCQEAIVLAEPAKDAKFDIPVYHLSLTLYPLAFNLSTPGT